MSIVNGFEETVKEMLDIVKKKNEDYAGEAADPFHNFRQVERLGITSTEKGILTRITDKLCRISNLIEKDPAVVSESIEDTLIDLANYAIILKLYLDDKKAKCTKCGLTKSD